MKISSRGLRSMDSRLARCGRWCFYSVTIFVLFLFHFYCLEIKQKEVLENKFKDFQMDNSVAFDVWLSLKELKLTHIFIRLVDSPLSDEANKKMHQKYWFLYELWSIEVDRFKWSSKTQVYVRGTLSTPEDVIWGKIVFIHILSDFCVIIKVDYSQPKLKKQPFVCYGWTFREWLEI